MSSITSQEAVQRSHVISKADLDAAGSSIRKVDALPDEYNLELFCYNRYNSETNEVIQHCRGTVFHGGKNLVQTFPHTREYRTEDREQIENIFPDCAPKDLAVFVSHEGTLLRVFHHNGKWFFMTHRKFDAWKSKWASRQSFGAQLCDAIVAEYDRNEEFRKRCGDPDKVPESTVFSTYKDLDVDKRVLQYLDTLSKDWCHCFLVRSTADNRIVCQAPTKSNGDPDPTAYHVGSFRKETAEFSMTPNDESTGIPWPETLKFDTWEEVYDYVSDTSPDSTQGAIIYRSLTDPNHVKILGTRYATLFAVRGNEPSIKYRYLQLRMDPGKVDELYKLYPRYQGDFEKYENILFLIAKQIHQAYVNRFIKKQYVTLDTEPYQVMKTCHDWHLTDRKKHRINMRQVQQVLNEQKPTDLNKMVRKHLQVAAAKRAEEGDSETLAGSALQPNSLQSEQMTIMSVGTVGEFTDQSGRNGRTRRRRQPMGNNTSSRRTGANTRPSESSATDNLEARNDSAPPILNGTLADLGDDQ